MQQGRSETSDGEWIELVRAYVDRHIDEATFHDRFFVLWHASSAGDWSPAPPPAIEQLFFVVEAYCPDPTLRQPDSPFEADDEELRASARHALHRLVAESKP